MRTVRQVYKIDDEELDNMDVLAEDSDYWANANKFVLQIIDRDIESLSDNQIAWLGRILKQVRQSASMDKEA